MSVFDVNLLGLGVSSVICFALGALWYSPKVFGTYWVAAQGKTMDELGSPGPAMAFQLPATVSICWLIGIIDLLHTNNALPQGMWFVTVAAFLLLTVAARLFLSFNAKVALVDAGYVAVLLGVPTLVYCLL